MHTPLLIRSSTFQTPKLLGAAPLLQHHPCNTLLTCSATLQRAVLSPQTPHRRPDRRSPQPPSPAQQRARMVTVNAQAGGSAGSSSSSNSHAGRAVLHDFCMTIPYSAIALLTGLVAAALRAPAVGLQLAGVGAAVALCSVLSLKSWKAGRSSTPYTLVSAGASGWIAYQMWQRVAAGVAPVPCGILLALSGVLAAFCVYNVLAGGNPPPTQKTA